MKINKLQIFTTIGFPFIWAGIIWLEESRVNKAQARERNMFVSDSLKSVAIDNLKERFESLKLSYEDCLSSNLQLKNENSKSKLKLRISDEECEHEKDMLYIEHSINNDDTGELLSKFGQLNSLSDVERMVLSEKSYRKPD